MTKPTIRELLDEQAARDIRWVDPAFRKLAERVEAVLKLEPIDYAADSQAAGFNNCLELVRRALNGEE
jgi:hypothetical protein